jgi:hypothetical protein
MAVGGCQELGRRAATDQRVAGGLIRTAAVLVYRPHSTGPGQGLLQHVSGEVPACRDGRSLSRPAPRPAG